jgi:polyisoprenoid-binding protein YceI
MSLDRPRSRRVPAIAAAVLAVVVIAGAVGLWYLFFRPAGPARVSLGTLPPVAAVASEQPSSAASSAAGSVAGATPSSASASASASMGQGGSADGIAGSWKVDPSIGSFSDFSGSFVGYRVQEQLATVGATEAVGRTPDVTGSVTVDGTTITAADFTADLTSLHSDESNRDRQLSRQGLETGTYPTATFKLTKPIDLGSVPAEGKAVSVTATGDLTLHGTTKSVDIPIQARLQGGVVTVAGSLPILFSDYGMQPPQAMIVLSVADNGTMEFQLQLTKG